MFTKKAARLADKLRFVSIFVLIALLVVGFLLKDKAGIEYFLYPVYDDKEVIDSVFEEENPFVVMYPNSAEDKVAATAAAIAADKDVVSVTTYADTLGIMLGVDEAVELISTRFPDLIGSVPPSMSAQITVIMQDLFKTYLGKEELDGTETVEMYGFVSYVLGDMLTDDSVNNIVKTMILNDPETKAQCESVKAMLDAAKAQLVGENYSRIMVATTLQKESDEAFAFVERLDGILKENMGEYYIMGNSYLAYEMRASYSDEVNLITLISIVLTFIVVALTFKSLIIPTVLVALIQCAVYLTLSFSYLAHLEFYYLAVIIVQAILMGATIDYAILFTNNYREKRKILDRADSLASAYSNSMHTILTSSSILFFVTLIIGLTAKDPSMVQVCLAIAIGSFFAVALCVIVLPGILAALDKPICYSAKKWEELSAKLKEKYYSRKSAE